MFAPPPVIETTVFATIPERYRLRGRRSTWVEVQRGGAATPSFLEGPAFDRQGNLYVVDVPYGRIFRVAPSAEVSLVAEYDGEPNGLAVHRDGRIFVADFRRGIMLLDPSTGAVTPVLERPNLDPFKGVNDLVFASNGDLYFTDQGMTGLQDPTGRVFRLRADGRLETLLDNVPSPNGLVLNPSETILYLAVTRGNCIWRVPLLAGGGVTKVGVFVQLSGGLGGPDGLALDEQGDLAIAHFGLGAVWLVSPLGEPLARIRSCAGLATTNVAYGGEDRRTLFITESESGSILTARVDVPGRRLFSHD